jgi:hypothetical protein
MLYLAWLLSSSSLSESQAPSCPAPVPQADAAGVLFCFGSFQVIAISPSLIPAHLQLLFRFSCLSTLATASVLLFTSGKGRMCNLRCVCMRISKCVSYRIAERALCESFGTTTVSQVAMLETCTWEWHLLSCSATAVLSQPSMDVVRSLKRRSSARRALLFEFAAVASGNSFLKNLFLQIFSSSKS